MSIQAGTADGDEIRIASEGCARNSRHTTQPSRARPIVARHAQASRGGTAARRRRPARQAAEACVVLAEGRRPLRTASCSAPASVLCPLQGDDLLTEQTISLREALCSEAFALAHLDGRKVPHHLPLPCVCHRVHELLRVSELEHMRLCLAFKGLCAARSKRSGPLGPAAQNPEYD